MAGGCKDDYVWVIPATILPGVEWLVVAGCYGPQFWDAPAAGDLAATQDSPSAESYCTESVAIP